MLVLDASAIDANVARMAAWCAERGVGLAPHGKTTMAPVLWERQLAAGAWGITLATPSQVRVALAFGLRRVLLANALVDPVGIAAVSRALDADPELQVLSWVDSVSSVAAMDDGPRRAAPRAPADRARRARRSGRAHGGPRPAGGARRGDAVAASPHLHLGGVAGYEGALAHDASPAGLDAVRRYLRDLAALHTDLAGAYEADEVIVTAGGSAYFDDVADILGPLTGPSTRVLLRSGAYVIHDDGFYRGISPFARHGDTRWRRRCTSGPASSPDPSPGSPCSTPASGTSRSTRGCPSRSWPPTRSGGRRAPGRVRSPRSTTSTRSCACPRTPRWTSVTSSGWACRTPARPSTSGGRSRWSPGSEDPDPVVVDLVRTYSNGASPQPDEPCRGRLGGRAPVGAETVTGGPARCMNRSKRLVGLLAARPTGAQ